MAKTVPKDDQNMVSFNKQYKEESNYKLARPKNEQVVLSYFESQNWLIQEGKKFYSYFEAIGWKMGGKIPILNWRACATSWMLKASEKEANRFKADNRFYVNQNKNYGEPL